MFLGLAHGRYVGSLSKIPSNVWHSWNRTPQRSNPRTTRGIESRMGMVAVSAVAGHLDLDCTYRPGP